jgi:hypothetical protein
MVPPEFGFTIYNAKGKIIDMCPGKNQAVGPCGKPAGCSVVPR